MIPIILGILAVLVLVGIAVAVWMTFLAGIEDQESKPAAPDPEADGTGADPESGEGVSGGTST